MKEKLIYSVLFIEYCEYGEFKITTNINETIKNHLLLWVKAEEKDKDKSYSSYYSWKKDYENYDNNPEKYNKFWIYYQKDFTTLKAAEKHVKFFKNFLDDMIAPVYQATYCGLREYLESINYWKD